MSDTHAGGGGSEERIIKEASTWTNGLGNGYTGTYLKTAALSVLTYTEPRLPDNPTQIPSKGHHLTEMHQCKSV